MAVSGFSAMDDADLFSRPVQFQSFFTDDPLRLKIAACFTFWDSRRNPSWRIKLHVRVAATLCRLGPCHSYFCGWNARIATACIVSPWHGRFAFWSPFWLYLLPVCIFSSAWSSIFLWFLSSYTSFCRFGSTTIWFGFKWEKDKNRTAVSMTLQFYFSIIRLGLNSTRRIETDAANGILKTQIFRYHTNGINLYFTLCLYSL